jgi:uncharacterized protein (TIGR00255 family)
MPTRNKSSNADQAGPTASDVVSPLRSMTGYAHQNLATEQWLLALELRCVNSRYLDLVFRLPDELRTTEPALRELLTSGIKRGKLECRLSLAAKNGQAKSIELNQELLHELFTSARAISTAPGAPALGALSVSELLRWPGVVANQAIPGQQLAPEVLVLATKALDELQKSREREGQQICSFMLQRIEQIQAHVTKLLARGSAWLENHQKQLVARLQETLGMLQDNLAIGREEVMARVRQEVVLYGLRIDVAEELSRLQTHMLEVRRVLDAGGLVGKRLDFLMQELNREANTLGSKAADIEVTQTAIDIKIAIEQMREQVQNLE